MSSSSRTPKKDKRETKRKKLTLSRETLKDLKARGAGADGVRGGGGKTNYCNTGSL